MKRPNFGLLGMFAAGLLVAALSVGVPSHMVLSAISANPVISVPGAGVGATPFRLLSAGTNNSTLIAAGPHTLYDMRAFSSNATAAYIKFYDKVTAPTCGTDVPKYVVPIIQNVYPPDMNSVVGLQFKLGIGMCIVALQADNDNTSATTGITVSGGYN